MELDSIEGLRDYLKNSLVADSEVGRRDLMNYVDYALQRFLVSLEYLPDKPGRVLELGANPYFMTLLMKKRQPYDLELANFFHEDSDPNKVYEQTIVNEKYGETHTFPYRQFNVEAGGFPYPDETFDGVLFCELLEHLVRDPVVALAEIHRVLRPGGWLLVTTPNFARYENIVKLWLARNPSDQYSGYGAYGRHNREYTYPELLRLVSSLGFKVERLEARAIHPRHKLDLRTRIVTWLKPARFHEDNLFCLAAKAGPCHAKRPAWLYRSLPDELMNWEDWL